MHEQKRGDCRGASTSTDDCMMASLFSLALRCASAFSFLAFTFAFSAFSFSTSSVSERFFLAISTILDSRTPAESRSPPVSSAVLSSAYSRSFASSACKSSWLRRVSSWTCVSRSKEGQVSWLGDIRGNTSETAMGVNRHASERRARRAPHMRGRTWPKPSHVKFSLFPAAVAIALPRLRSSARASRRGESR